MPRVKDIMDKYDQLRIPEIWRNVNGNDGDEKEIIGYEGPLTIAQWNGLVDTVRERDLRIVEALTIENNKVGIGTDTPKATLHVRGNAGTINIEGSNHTYLQFYPRGFQNGRKAWLGFGNSGSKDLQISNEDDGKLILKTKGWDGLVIQTIRRVGVGTKTPAHTLDLVSPGSAGLIISSNEKEKPTSLRLATARPDLAQSFWDNTKGSGNKGWMLQAQYDDEGSPTAKENVFNGVLRFRYYNDASWKNYFSLNPKKALAIFDVDIRGRGLKEMIEFKRYQSSDFKFYSPKALKDGKGLEGVGNTALFPDRKRLIRTEKIKADYSAGISGFNTGKADIEERGSGRFMAVRMILLEVKLGANLVKEWFIEANLRTHNDHEDFIVDVCFVSTQLSKATDF